MHNNRIYLDYSSTTPVDHRVLNKMLPFFSETFGNPHSSTHSFGWEARESVENARNSIASLINADPSEIIFTSGATESNNLAIKGAAAFQRNEKKHIITQMTEHKCVLDTCRYMSEEQNYDITYLPVDKNGLINIEQLEQSITKNTLMVSIMTINNEIGTIQPIAEIGAICRKHNIIFHTDAAQAFGKIPLNVKEMQIDMMSISGHKIYAPKGIGVLYVGKKPRIRLKPLINGGAQERGFRSGTLPTPLVVALGEAAEIAKSEMQADHARISKLSSKFRNFLQSLPEVYINSNEKYSYPGCVNASFAHVEGESMMGAIKNIAVSSGSACTSESLESSYVLKAIGINEGLSHTSIRFSIGKYTTEQELDQAMHDIELGLTKLRSMSPLWEMHQKGIDIDSIKWSGHHH